MLIAYANPVGTADNPFRSRLQRSSVPSAGDRGGRFNALPDAARRRLRDALLIREKRRHQGVRVTVTDLVLGLQTVDEFHVLKRTRLLKNIHPMRDGLAVCLFDGRKV